MTMQGVHGWMGPSDIAFAAYCCGIFVLAGFVFFITCNLLRDRGFKCRLLNVVNVVWCYTFWTSIYAYVSP